MNSESQSLTPTLTINTANVVSGLVRFFHAVRIRKGTLLATMLISGVLGALYYATATRFYDAHAQVWVRQTGHASGQSKGGQQSEVDNVIKQIPTFQKLIVCDEVLKAALKELPKQHEIDFKGLPRRTWETVLKNNVIVSSDRGSELIDVRYRSRHPKTAEHIVTRIVGEYVRYINETQRTSDIDTLHDLNERKDAVSAQIKEKDAEYLELQNQTNGVIDPEGKSVNLVSARVIELNKALIEMQRTTLESWAFAQSVNTAIARREDMQQFAMQAVETLGQTLLLKMLGLDQETAQVMAQANQEIMRLRSEFNERRATLGDNHPDIRYLWDQVRMQQESVAGYQAQTRASLQQLSSSELGPRLKAMAEQRYNLAAARQLVLQAQFDQEKTLAQNQGAILTRIELTTMERQRLLGWEQSLIEKINNLDLSAAHGLEVTRSKTPQAALTPSSPRLVLVVAVCLLLGMGSGLGTIYVLDLLDDRFRSPDELRTQLGVPVLAMVRSMQPTEETGVGAIHCHAKPNGVETEAFRTLRTALAFSDRQSTRLVVTSTEPGDGKTTIMSNLAVAFAQSGKKTLLIDADMRRPGLTALLNLKGQAGLSQILRDERPIQVSVADNLVQQIVPGLDVLPSGSRPSNPAELLSGDRFAELLAWAETIYDQILVDAPPVLAVADPIIIGRLVDGAVLVVRPDKNRRRMVIRATEAFASVEANLLGIVVNHLSSDSTGDYYGYGYGYGYDYGYGYGYGHGYGHDDVANETEPVDEDEPDEAILELRRAA